MDVLLPERILHDLIQQLRTSRGLFLTTTNQGKVTADESMGDGESEIN